MIDPATVYAAISRTTCEVVPEVDAELISMDATLAELGCNSIDRADIMSLVMDDLAVNVPVHEFHSGHIIGTLVDLLCRYS